MAQNNTNPAKVQDLWLESATLTVNPAKVQEFFAIFADLVKTEWKFLHNRRNFGVLAIFIRKNCIFAAFSD
ncbi:hypothetical protein [Paenibacillus sp. 32O-W]|uniref:hypothetical protein n=1 Tax=Paenibacillus sp. 32O-W TaxID=1695218 RepID=UPI0011AEA610|nr:hypothetical protein [Paenibacillus sp. 32O-W]